MDCWSKMDCIISYKVQVIEYLHNAISDTISDSKRSQKSIAIRYDENPPVFEY